MKYTCTNCGKEHDDWPALTFNAPDSYHDLSEEEKQTIAVFNTDFCTITYEDQTDRFIRVTLIQKVNDHCDYLHYGLWVSLSEKSFNDYSDNYTNEFHETGYFGYLCNRIPNYENTLNIHTNVYTQPGNQRPIIEPHEGFDHPFVRDYYNGISKIEAESRIKAMMEK